MEITKINYTSNNCPQNRCAFKGTNAPQKQDVEKEKTGGSEALANYNKVGIAKSDTGKTGLDKYVMKDPLKRVLPHQLFYYSKGGGSYISRGAQKGIWKIMSDENAKKTPWKMHIYADNEADWQKLVYILGRYLKDESCSWKTVSATTRLEDLENLSQCQKGKAFTIYPHSNKQFAKIAHDLNYILKESNMQLDDAQITGDRALGDSGRIFYRYEYKSGKDKDLILDLSNDDENKLCGELYRPNTPDGSYLADDMTESDDIWLNFDPDTDGEEFIAD